MFRVSRSLSERLKELVRELAAKDGVTVVLIEHDMAFVRDLADAVVVRQKCRVFSGSEKVGGIGTRILELMTVVPILAAVSEKRAGLLSGGQRQSLAVATLLMRRPRLLLLDEPVAGMALEAGRHLLEAVKVLRRKEGFPLVIVEHWRRQVRPRLVARAFSCTCPDFRTAVLGT